MQAADTERLAKALRDLPPQQLEILERQLDSQDTHEDLWQSCQDDIWFWLTEYVYTINQHREKTVLGGQPKTTLDPFPRYPHTEQVVEATWKPSNVIIEKSRDMMLTWTVCAVYLWDLLFTPSVPMFMTTYREALVDDGGARSTPDSLLGRIRHMYMHLPDWMRQRAPLTFKQGLVRNETSGAFISGKKSHEHSSRSGKYYRAFADEFAHFERSEANLAALTPACPTGLILGSTPGRTGKYNAFGRICCADVDEDGTHSGFQKITLHWSMHPDRTHEWYLAETRKLSSEDRAREYDISYEGAVEARVWDMDPEIHRRSDLEYDPELPLYLAFDHGLNEESVIFVQVKKWIDEETNEQRIERRIIDEYQGGVPVFGVKMTPWENVQNLKDKLTAEPYNLELDDNGKIRGLGGCFGDPRGKDDVIPVQSRKTDDRKMTSWHSVYQQHGFYIQSKFSKVKDGIMLVADWTQDRPPTLVIAARCRMVWEALVHHRHKTDKETGQVLDSVVEDWTKHFSDTVRYFAVNTSSIRQNKAAPANKYRTIWIRTRTGARRPVYERVG